MSVTTVAIEHEDKVYKGQLAKIDKTSFGYGDHGILTAMLHCSWKGGGIGVGGYCLDEPWSHDREHPKRHERKGTAYGLDHIIRILETVGVSSWEDLPGKQVIVLFDAAPDKSTWGSMAIGIAGLLNERVLLMKEHATMWREMEEAELLQSTHTP